MLRTIAMRLSQGSSILQTAKRTLATNQTQSLVQEATSAVTFQKLLNNAGDKLVVVDFYATWCGPCKMLTPVLAKVTQSQDVLLVKVDVDQVADVAAEYEISSLPTVVAVKRSRELERFVGVKDEQAVRKFIAQHNRQ